LFDTESKRKIKKEPTVAFELKKNLFPAPEEEQGENEDVAVIPPDVVSELWVF